MGRKAFALIVTALFFYVASPLLLPVTMGGVLAVLFFPTLERMERRKIPLPVASSLLTVGITLIVLVPTALLIFFGTRAGLHQLVALREAPTSPETNWIDNLIQTPGIHGILEWITAWFPVRMDELIDTTHELAHGAGSKMTDMLAAVVTALPGFALALVVVVVSVYFFLIDGRRLVIFCRRHSFFDEVQTARLMSAIGTMCRSVILASVLSGAIQALLETIFCVSTGTPNAALIGIVVLIASFIPVVGSAPVTLAVAAEQFLVGRTTVGIVLGGAVILIMMSDNIVRPWVLKGAGNLHPFLAFVAAFGGLQMFGFIGVFLGPIAAGLFVVVVDILLQKDDDVDRTSAL
jgi:predicted PurR-regulated permease PerM